MTNQNPIRFQFHIKASENMVTASTPSLSDFSVTASWQDRATFLDLLRSTLTLYLEYKGLDPQRLFFRLPPGNNFQNGQIVSAITVPKPF